MLCKLCCQNSSKGQFRKYFVDDLLKWVTSEQEGVSLIKEMINLMKGEGFRLTTFINNNENVMKTITETEKANSLQSASFNSNIKEGI